MTPRRALASALIATALVGCTGNEAPAARQEGRGGSAIPSPSPPQSPSAEALPSGAMSAPPRASAAPASPGPSPAGLVLGGAELGVTQVGDSKKDSVRAVTRELGPADLDPPEVACVSAVTEASWDGFRLGFDQAGRVSGWAATSPRLRTPSGIGVGSTVADLRQTYGARLRLFEPSPDGGWSYTVDGVDMVGALSGGESGSAVEALLNGSCSGP